MFRRRMLPLKWGMQGLYLENDRKQQHLAASTRCHLNPQFSHGDCVGLPDASRVVLCWRRGDSVLFWKYTTIYRCAMIFYGTVKLLESRDLACSPIATPAALLRQVHFCHCEVTFKTETWSRRPNGTPMNPTLSMDVHGLMFQIVLKMVAHFQM